MDRWNRCGINSYPGSFGFRGGRTRTAVIPSQLRHSPIRGCTLRSQSWFVKMGLSRHLICSECQTEEGKKKKKKKKKYWSLAQSQHTNFNRSFPIFIRRSTSTLYTAYTHATVAPRWSHDTAHRSRRKAGGRSWRRKRHDLFLPHTAGVPTEEGSGSGSMRRSIVQPAEVHQS